MFGRKKERARVSILGTDPIQLNGVLAAKQDKVAHQRRNRQIAATLTFLCWPLGAFVSPPLTSAWP